MIHQTRSVHQQTPMSSNLPFKNPEKSRCSGEVASQSVLLATFQANLPVAVVTPGIDQACHRLKYPEPEPTCKSQVKDEVQPIPS